MSRHKTCAANSACQPGPKYLRETYWPDEDRWKSSDDIHKKIIPWLAEWLVFYELFLITGKWLGPEAPHAAMPKVEESHLP
jgi:hypothetical protein